MVNPCVRLLEIRLYGGGPRNRILTPRGRARGPLHCEYCCTAIAAAGPASFTVCTTFCVFGSTTETVPSHVLLTSRNAPVGGAPGSYPGGMEGTIAVGQDPTGIGVPTASVFTSTGTRLPAAGALTATSRALGPDALVTLNNIAFEPILKPE